MGGWPPGLPCFFPVVGVLFFLRFSGLIYNHSMKALAEMMHVLQVNKPYLRERFGVEVISVFGSYVRNEQRPDSDIDIFRG
jgi:hypothetical protein